jgi:hypothetical protein
MSSLLSVRTNVTADPNGSRIIDVSEFVSCRYGEGLDGAEECSLVVRRDSPALGALAIRNVLRLRNELGEVREYRIKHLYDEDLTPTARIKATPILHDLGDVTLQMLVNGVWTETFTATLSPRGWCQLIVDNMARRGKGWWSVGEIGVDGAATITVAGESCLAVARRLVEGTLASVVADRDGDDGFLLSLRVLLPTKRPLVIVGKNVQALDREIHADLQATIVSVTGLTSGGDLAAQSIEEVPFVLEANPSQGIVEVSDRDLSEAPFAIEDDQFVGNDAPGVLYPDKALVGLVPPPVEVTISGDSGAELSRMHAAARVGDQLWCAIRRGAAVGQLVVVDLPTGAITATHDLTVVAPTSIVYVESADRLFIAGEDEVDVVDPADGSVESTITLAGAFWLHHDTTNDMIWTTADAGMVLIDPSDNSLTTITNATIGATVTPTRIADGDGVLWCLADLAGAWQLVRFDVATMAFDDLTDIDADLEDASDDHRLLAYASGVEEVWVASVTGDLSLFAAADSSLVATIAAAVHGGGAITSLVGWDGWVHAGVEENRIASFNANADLIVDDRFQSLGAVGAADTQTDVHCLSLLGDGWYVVGGTDTTRTTFFLRFWSATSRGGHHLREITAVNYLLSRVTLAGLPDLLPWRLNDPVWVTNLDGTRFREMWSPLAVGIYGHIDKPTSAPDRRAERNLVRVPMPETFDANEQPDGWELHAYETDHFERRWREGDGYTQAVVSGLTATTPTPSTSDGVVDITIEDLPGNFVVQPGDMIKAAGSTFPFTIMQRALVTAGPVVIFADTFGSSSGAASGHTPTDPGASGVTGYDYNSGLANIVTASGVLRQNNGGFGVTSVCRVDADIADDNFGLICDLRRTAIEGGEIRICFHVPGSGDTEYYYVRIIPKPSVNTQVLVGLTRVPSAGVDDDEVNATLHSVNFARGNSESLPDFPRNKRFRVTVTGLLVTVYVSDAGTGANETELFSHTLAVDYRGGGHERMGFAFVQDATFWDRGFEVDYWGISDLNSTADAPGLPITVPCVSQHNSPLNNASATLYRPLPASLADLDEWFVLAWDHGGPVEGQDAYLDVHISEPLRTIHTLRLALGAICANYHFGQQNWEQPTLQVTLTSRQGTPVTLLDETLDIPLSNYVTGETALLDVVLTPDAPVAYGWYRLRLRLTAVQGSVVLYNPTVSIWWGTEDLPAFRRSAGGGWLWRAAQEYLVDRSSPLAHYRVEATEEDSALPFLLGARVRLRDPERGLATNSPRIIAVRRWLLPQGEDVRRDPPRPEIELDNRPLELIAQLVSKGSV